jgi:hypothetical protein
MIQERGNNNKNMFVMKLEKSKFRKYLFYSIQQLL